MAGIAFALQRLVRRHTITDAARAYGYGGLISAGPWVLSIASLLVVGALTVAQPDGARIATALQVSINHLIVSSLVLAGAIQLPLARFVADRLFEQRLEAIGPNLVGVALLVSLASGGLGIAAVTMFFGSESPSYRMLMLAGFVLFAMQWVATTLLTTLERALECVGLIAIGYAASIALSLALRPFGLEAMFGGFLCGQALLVAGALVLVLRAYPSERFIDFAFLDNARRLGVLAACGSGYALAVWIDKLLFWWLPETSIAVIGPLRHAPRFDPPLVIAALAMVPGMAVLLVSIETEFARAFTRFYDAVRNGATIRHIEMRRDGLVYAVRGGLGQIARIQGITVLIVVAAGPQIIQALGFDASITSKLYWDVIAMSLQVLLLAMLTVFYYLDRCAAALRLIALCLILNAALTLVTLWLGPWCHGMGFAVALAVTVVRGFATLDRRLGRLEYETFMLNR